jgi:phospholipid-translocating ATPase
MHSIRPTITVAASSSTSARRTIRAGKGKVRRKDRYIDDPEEEAGLLKGEVYGADGDEEYEDVEEQLPRGGSPTSVCCVCVVKPKSKLIGIATYAYSATKAYIWPG